MGRGTGVGARLLICFICIAINILIHVLFLLWGLYYLAEKESVESQLLQEAIDSNKYSPKELYEEAKKIKSRVETGGMIITVFSIVSLSVLVGVIFLVLKKDPKLLRSYSNGLGLVLTLFPFLFNLFYTFVWHAKFWSPVGTMCFLSTIGHGISSGAVDRYRRELLLVQGGGNVGGGQRGWATPRPDVDTASTAANVNDQAAPAPASNEAAPEGDQNAGSA